MADQEEANTSNRKRKQKQLFKVEKKSNVSLSSILDNPETPMTLDHATFKKAVHLYV